MQHSIIQQNVFKKPVTHRQLTMIARKLALASVMMVGLCSGIHAQNFSSYPTNPEYGKIVTSGVHQLLQFKVADGDRFPSTSSDVPRINITSECSAANGYGVWTVSSNFGSNVQISGHDWDFSPDQKQVTTTLASDWSPNGASGWLLTGNMISKPSETYDGTSNHPGVQPTGVVSGGLFQPIGSVAFDVPNSQAAANLLGSVRFVCVDPSDRSQFIVEGLNDARGATSNDQQIDISISDPHLPAGRQVVHKPIWVYPTTGGTPGTVSTGSHIVKMISSSITGCTENGINVAGASGAGLLSEVDLSGYHYNYPTDDIEALNTISGNATSSTSTFSQILINNGIIDYGNIGGWGHWGKNNTFYTTASASNALIAGTANIGNIDNNFWGAGIDPDPTIPACTTGTNIHANGYWHNNSGFCFELNCSVAFTATIPAIAQSTTPSSVTCSPVYPSVVKSSNSEPMSIPTSYDTCAHLKIWETRDPQGNDSLRAIQQYDSLKLYIEKCAVSDPQSYFAFNHLDGAVQMLSSDTSRFTTYRNWLISVLYLNRSIPEYFCVCLGSIAGTYQVGKFDPLGYLAVLNYMRQTQPCGWDSNSAKEYTKDSLLDYQMGYDPTHLPSLDSMGLGFLLHNEGVTPTASTPYLPSFSTNPNPFTTETKLNFTLNQMAYVTVEVYDLLGNKVFGKAGKNYDAGSYEINLDGSTLPSGTLYARISTGFGEVKTVKLVHEK